MSFFLYTLISTIYIVTIYFAIGIKKQFKLILMIGFLVLGGGIGQIMNSYETGLIVAIVLSLLFW